MIGESFFVGDPLVVGRPKTIVKALSQGKTLTLGALMKSYAFGSKRYFGGLGDKDVQWQERDGTWQVGVDLDQVLAGLFIPSFSVHGAGQSKARLKFLPFYTLAWRREELELKYQRLGRRKWTRSFVSVSPLVTFCNILIT